MILCAEVSADRGITCSYLLAELGADVICVEPDGGCASRQRGPFFKSQQAKDEIDAAKRREQSLHWWAYARNKRSIVLAPEAAQDREAECKPREATASPGARTTADGLAATRRRNPTASGEAPARSGEALRD